MDPDAPASSGPDDIDDGLLERAAEALLGTVLLAAAAARGALDPEADRGDEDRDGSTVDGAGADVLVGLAADVGRRSARAVTGTARAAGSAARWVVAESPLSGPAGRALDSLAAEGQEERRATTDAAGRLVSELATRIATEIVDLIDVNAIVEQVDVDAIVRRVDVDAIVRRVDIQDIVDRIDLDEVVGGTQIGRLVVESTGGVAGEMLDVVRSQAVGLDRLVGGAVNGLLRRDADDLPKGPPLLVGPSGDGERSP